MLTPGFGSPDHYNVDPLGAVFQRFRRQFWWTLAIVLVLVGLRLAARGGCTIPPPMPQDVRRNAICQALGRAPDCPVKLKRLMAATVYPTESDYSVYVNSEFVGTWPILDGLLVDPNSLTREVVEHTVLFTMGTAELQQRLKLQFRCARVGYVDRLLEWELGRFSIQIACVS